MAIPPRKPARDRKKGGDRTPIVGSTGGSQGVKVEFEGVGLGTHYSSSGSIHEVHPWHE